MKTILNLTYLRWQIKYEHGSKSHVYVQTYHVKKPAGAPRLWAEMNGSHEVTPGNDWPAI